MSFKYSNKLNSVRERNRQAYFIKKSKALLMPEHHNERALRSYRTRSTDLREEQVLNLANKENPKCVIKQYSVRSSTPSSRLPLCKLETPEIHNSFYRRMEELERNWVEVETGPVLNLFTPR